MSSKGGKVTCVVPPRVFKRIILSFHNLLDREMALRTTFAISSEVVDENKKIV